MSQKKSPGQIARENTFCGAIKCTGIDLSTDGTFIEVL